MSRKLKILKRAFIVLMAMVTVIGFSPHNIIASEIETEKVGRTVTEEDYEVLDSAAKEALIDTSNVNKTDLDVNAIFTSSSEAQAIYNSAKTVSYNDFKTKELELFEGLTVIYGNNIDTTEILEKYSPGKDAISSDKSSEKLINNEDSQSNVEKIDNTKNTYLTLCMKQGDRLDIQCVSVTYETGVSQTTIEKFINAEHSKSTVDYRVKEFSVQQVIDSTSAYNSVSKSSNIVQTLRDTNYFIANYEPIADSIDSLPVISAPVMVFKNDIVYQATQQSDLEEFVDYYVIIAYVTTTPGNAISSFTAAEYASLDAADIKNDSFGDKIVIKGIRTIFENLYPDEDYYITMSPQEDITNAEGSNISVSLGVSPPVSLSFNVDVSTSARIDMETSFDPYGQCIVQFEAFQRLLINTLPRLSTEPFSYTAGVYLCSNMMLYTSVATDILYCFQSIGYATTSPFWAGSARTFCY